MNWTKEMLFTTSGAFWETCTLHTGVKLKIFSHLGSLSLSCKEVAKKINGDTKATSSLLNALTAMNLINKADNLYSNTDFAKQYLCENSKDYKGYIIMHHHHIMFSWVKMYESILTGKPVQQPENNDNEETQIESFLMGMFNIASETAPYYAQILDLTNLTKMLDMGGGPGTYSIHFCKANPHLHAMVLDLPSTKKFAQKTIESFDLSEKIEFKEGSFLDKNLQLKQEFDMAWLSHILHGENEQDSQEIIARAAKALKPGGKIFIHEFILEDSRDKPLFPALFDLNMLVLTQEGKAYSQKELTDLLKKNNIENISRIKLNSPNNAGIIMGIKK